ncbi:hypothetical protein [Micromonospora sp. WMMC273]|uniref:hypothetical protein n=1 Tax=Micromonospora sp. WMMC273 TaxID=3015157 RepID=UPI0022B72D78|nr:hypothetical protein [Micromonospora sp. WMMC273]MCZ7478914.1 hypothetical protein [Micromonospora sp. WMMC273]
MIDPLAPLTEQELSRSEIVREPVAEPMAVVPVKLPVELLNRLKAEADAAGPGIGVSTLLRQLAEARYAPGAADLVAVHPERLRVEIERAVHRAASPLPPSAAA